MRSFTLFFPTISMSNRQTFSQRLVGCHSFSSQSTTTLFSGWSATIYRNTTRAYMLSPVFVRHFFSAHISWLASWLAADWIVLASNNKNLSIWWYCNKCAAASAPKNIIYKIFTYSRATRFCWARSGGTSTRPDPSGGAAPGWLGAWGRATTF